MDKPEKAESRTDWAEKYVERLVSMPFISEFVFRSPRRDKNGLEVADFLISQGEINIVISQKCQDDPTSRTLEKNELWVLKETKHGLSQLLGGLKKFKSEPFWCNHPRRGKVNFSMPLNKIDEAIVLVETRHPVDLGSQSEEFPLEDKGVPITYLSVNDFLNLVTELRTVPELLRYLRERRALPENDLRLIGDDGNLFPLYILNDRHFDGCGSRVIAKQIIEKEEKRIVAAVQFKKANDIYCMRLEHVAHELSTRNPKIPKFLEVHFEPIEERTGYLKMLLALADMELPDRILLGKSFDDIIQKLENSGRSGSDLVYSGCHSDSKPDWAFVFAASKEMELQEVLVAVGQLGHGALAAYDKYKCLIVVARDDVGYEVGYLSRTGDLTAEQKQWGDRFFSNLKMTSKKLSILPG